MKCSVFQDWAANRGNVKGRIVLLMFRLATIVATMPRPLMYFGYPYVAFYRVFVEWGLGVELPWRLKIGAELKLFHGQALVVNDRVVIGARCVLRHSTTIGVAHTSSTYSGNAPRIGDGVDIGSNVVIVGNITIGDGALIAAGAVVVKDVPPYVVVGGNPARVLRSV